MFRRTAYKLGETITDNYQLNFQYQQCDIGQYYKAIEGYLASNTTCLHDVYKTNSLKVAVKLTLGQPKVKVSCSDAACYQCLASLGCGLDDFVKAATLGRVDAELYAQPLTEQRTYLGDRQLSFDGKGQFVTLPQFGKYSDEFTFEAWVAWNPTFAHATNGATVKIFDFFAEDESRKEAIADSEREFKARHAELRKLDQAGRDKWQAEMKAKRDAAQKK